MEMTSMEMMATGISMVIIGILLIAFILVWSCIWRPTLKESRAPKASYLEMFGQPRVDMSFLEKKGLQQDAQRLADDWRKIGDELKSMMGRRAQ